MTGPVFVDTNVLVYAMDDADREKQQRAGEWRAALWESRRGRTSFQVLQEFYLQATRKWPEAREEVRAEIRDLLAWRPVGVSRAVLELAWKVQDRYRLSFWDALIVAAAKTAECSWLLTEDLQAGQDLVGVRVISPFTSRPDL